MYALAWTLDEDARARIIGDVDARLQFVVRAIVGLVDV